VSQECEGANLAGQKSVISMSTFSRVVLSVRLVLTIVILVGAWLTTALAQHPVVDTMVHHPPVALDTSLLATDTMQLPVAASLSLEDAIQRALRFSPIIERARANVDVSHAAQRVAFAEYLPQLAISSSVYQNGSPQIAGNSLNTVLGPIGLGTNPTAGGGTVSDSAGIPTTTGTPGLVASRTAATSGAASVVAAVDSAPGGTTTPTSTTSSNDVQAFATITAGWDVLTWGRRGADNRRARAEARAAASMNIEQRFIVTDTLKTVFYSVLRSEELENVARAQVRRASEDARAAGRRHEVGTATPADVLQFELNLNNARVSLVQASTQRQTAAYALGRLTDIDGAVEAIPDDSLFPRPLALPDTAIVALAIREGPAIVAARDSADAASAAATAERSTYAPTLRLGSSYTVVRQQSAAVTSGAVRGGWALGLSTSYPIFNGFVRNYQVTRADAAASLARTVARDAERAARADAERLLGTIALAGQLVRLARDAVIVARENYRVQGTRYGVGVATVLDLSSAETQLTQAEQQLVSARYSYVLARASLATLVGRDL
jgi:outer membrane protein